MKNIQKTKKMLNVILAIILSALIESYITVIENANLVVVFSFHYFINLFTDSRIAQL